MANLDVGLFVPPLADPGRSRTPETRQPQGMSKDYTGYPVLPGPPAPAFPSDGPWHPTLAPTHPMAAGMYHGGGPPPAWVGGFMPGPGTMPPHPLAYRGALPFQQYGRQILIPPEPPKVGDRVDPFTAGKHYGPVLEPFLLRVVGAQIKINPLLQPPQDKWDIPHLQWNMLFPSAQCRRSTDDQYVPWHSGRHEPAAFPRITFMRIVSEVFPWIFTIHAEDLTVGVTCGDVIDTLAENFSRLSSSEEYEKLPSRRRNQVSVAYSHNRSTAHDVPGELLGPGMRRLDFLCKDTMYGGIVVDEEVLRSVCEDVLPCTFVLRCSRRQQEIQE